jgi:hypothetical protein
MKNYLYIIFWSCLVLIINGCNKESLSPKSSTYIQESLLPVDSAYDNYAANMALAVHQSLNDSQFTKTLKNEIMQRPDGDYEVILKSFINKNIDLSHTVLFKNLVTNGTKGIVDNEKYPKLQIAIPVNAEKWDGSSKLWVLYKPSNYDEFSSKTVPAISPEGKKTMFNIEKQPDFPVIVIGQNERSNENGDLKYVYNILREKVKLNTLALHPKDGEGFTSFSATPVTNAMAVNLDWTFIYPDYLEPYDHYFEIYRDDLLGGGFQKIGEADSWQSFYYDPNVLPSRTYAYYVVVRVDINETYNHNDYEEYFYSESDDAAIPAIPTFTSNFAVECIAPNTMQLTWTINNISNWTNLTIERYTSYNPTPVVIAQLPLTAISYQDNLGTPSPAYGVSYRYTLRVSNVNTGAQQAYYCDEMLSNRINYQVLKVTHIQWSSFDDMRKYYESWLNGAPEVRLTVFKAIGETSSKLNDNQLIGGPAHTGFDTEPGPITICEWWETDSKVYTISLNEEDGGNNKGLEVSVGASAKTPKIFGTELTLSFNLKGTIFKGNLDDFIGTGYIYWWNNANGKDVQCGSHCKATLMSVQE